MSIAETFQSSWQQWRANYPRRRLKRIPNDIKWGKRLFSDTTPATDHFRGQLFWAHARILGGSKPTTSAGIDSRRKGLRLLGQIASDDVLRPIIQKLSAALSERRDDDYYYKGTLATRSLVFATREVPELMQLLTPKILDPVREYYGCNFRLSHVSAWRNWHVPSFSLAEEAYSNNWHTDGRRIDMIKVWVTGSDVTLEDGPTHALTREWTHEIVKRGFENRRDYGLPVDVIENPEHLVRLTGPAGSALLCNTNLCFHRAGIIGEGRYRDLFEFRFWSNPTFSLEMPDNDRLPWRDRILQDL